MAQPRLPEGVTGYVRFQAVAKLILTADMRRKAALRVSADGSPLRAESRMAASVYKSSGADIQVGIGIVVT
jgi:hypothetical protein